jgi:hypothetical protein
MISPTHLSDDTKWMRLERALWAATVAAYELVVSGVRLDSTTVSGYHTHHEDGLMQLGYSKENRPDLTQVKLTVAAAEPEAHGLAVGKFAKRMARAQGPIPCSIGRVLRVCALWPRRQGLFDKINVPLTPDGGPRRLQSDKK